MSGDLLPLTEKADLANISAGEVEFDVGVVLFREEQRDRTQLEPFLINKKKNSSARDENVPSLDREMFIENVIRISHFARPALLGTKMHTNRENIAFAPIFLDLVSHAFRCRAPQVVNHNRNSPTKVCPRANAMQVHHHAHPSIHPSIAKRQVV